MSVFLRRLAAGATWALLLSAALPSGVDGAQAAPSCLTPLLMEAADPLVRADRGQPGEQAQRGRLAEIGDEGALCRTLEPDPRHQEPTPASMPSPMRAALFSALLPGMGQRYLDQGRWIVYLGIEVWSWVQFFDERAQGNKLQTEYRDLAWSVARRVSSGPRVDGDFDYYESLTKFGESGAWDADPARPGIQPEPDPETYNGSIWELARDIFIPPNADGGLDEDSPAYRNALAYYEERGVTPRFAWSWRENELQQAVYGDIIQQSDETLRNSTTMAGVIIANHVVSAVDALISARLRLPNPETLSIEVVPFPDRRSDWALIVRVAH